MATAKRLYLYFVSGTGLGMALFGAIAMLHLLLNRIGLGPQNSGSALSTDSDRDLLAMAVAVGIVGLALWIFHWAVAERMVKAEGDAGSSERASIVRSVYFAIVLAILLGVAAVALVQQLSDSIANILGARLSYSMSLDDSWSVAAIVVFFAAWAYHAWVRARDVRQATPIEGAAAWISRFYLYGAAFIGLGSMLGSISSIISTAGSAILNNSNSDISSMIMQSQLASSSTPWWVRPVVAAIVGLAVWGAIWLGHWLYSNRLRLGSSSRSVSEQTSRVRLAFLMVVVIWGVASVAGAVAGAIGQLVANVSGVQSFATLPLWYTTLVPVIAALPALAAWLLHRRRAFAEATVGPAGVSAARIASYLTAWVGLGLIADGLELALSTAFGKWLPGSNNTGLFGSTMDDTTFKMELAFAAGYLIAGLIFWVWPWFSSQRRRHEPASTEIGSSSRGYYLYLVVGSAIVGGAFSLAMILYPYLRLAFGLPEANLASTINMPLSLLIVSAGLLAYHVFVLRGDARPPRLPDSWQVATELPAPPALEPPAQTAPDAPAAPDAPTAPDA
jgi:hypothetical protein